MEEIWKPIKGYEGLYLISNLGNVKTVKRIYYSGVGNKTPRIQKEKLLKKYNGYGLGYKTVILYKDSKPKSFYIHRLVAEHFLQQVQGKDIVNHIDGDKSNNNVCNLEWVTQSENVKHAFKNGLRSSSGMKGKTGIKNKNSKHVLQFDLNGVLIKEWNCISDVARYFNVKPSSIVNCTKGRLKTVKGYKWVSP